MGSETKPIFFPTLAQWRTWLEKNHADAAELWVGFHKKGSGKPSITWPESVDGALCFGWIDGIRKSLDETSYLIRFTPRRRQSIWSSVNIKRIRALAKLGLIHSAGRKAFDLRTGNRSEIYAYEQQKTAALSAKDGKQFRANKTAWNFFQSMPPWYRRKAIYWVISAKKAETRQKRLAKLIDDSAHLRSIAELKRRQKSKNT
jgi:uncharacterized protein YdeI (YjbR/CyaY-like superfamily)